MQFSRYIICLFTQLNSLAFVKVREPPRTKLKLCLRLVFIKLLSANGDGEIRTLDPLLARQVLSQLSYTPTDAVPSSVVSFVSFLFDGLSRWLSPMGLSGLEPPTSRLSGVRSNRLSYKPI